MAAIKSWRGQATKSWQRESSNQVLAERVEHKKTWYLMVGAEHKVKTWYLVNGAEQMETWNLMDGAKHRRETWT